MRWLVLGIFLFGCASAQAQQQGPPGPVSPEELAHQIDDATWGMAKRIRDLEATVSHKDEELAKAKARIGDLEAKHSEEKKGGSDGPVETH
jgi:hypothetical protein